MLFPETEYRKMPALYEMDDYDLCMTEGDEGTYCLVDFDLFSRQRSALMNFIQQYSAHTKKHFNHTQIHRAVCVTTTCKNYLPTNKTVDLNASLEACINETIWQSYHIEAKFSNIQYCNKKGEKKEVTKGDILVVGVFGIIIVLNMVGTFYDIIVSKSENKAGNRFLLALSLKKNWDRMVAPSGKGPDSRLERLRVINGLRSMTMVCVIFSHTVLTMAFSYVENPLYLEKAYDDPLKHILYNGTLVTCTFFVMSSFLLVFNFLIYTENHQVSLWDFPKGVVLRWLRLTPSYALMIALIATLIRHFGNGPLWKMVVESESIACQKKWWTNILYINNYTFDDVNCMPQSWYLAADTQLFTLTLLILLVARTPRARNIAVILMFIVSLVVLAGITYFNDLDATIIQSPETYRRLYAENYTFRLSYIPGHANISAYVFGFIAAILVYRWHDEKKDISKYRKYLWAYWLLCPAGVAVILSGGLFYIDGVDPSLLFRTLYATFHKVIFQFLLTIFMVGCIFKLDNVYRPIVEWRGFSWMSRVSYSAFLVHTVFQRCLLGIQMRPMYLADYYASVLLHSSIFSSYLVGASLYLFVEAPVAALMKAILSPPKPETAEENK
ncbi:unnamed protein product [Leptosia nina]|uniref:Acyltransferase 3 domain-containing protein n=1 Tax=Leptosia nina TaxID=320188 RepID=A0AAV1JNY4_9NEOP